MQLKGTLSQLVDAHRTSQRKRNKNKKTHNEKYFILIYQNHI